MISKYILFILLGVELVILFFQASELSISYYEANILYGDFSFLQLITKTSLMLFGHSDIALRLPMIILHTLSVVLLYSISDKYLKNQNDRVWLVLIFMLLPGIISSALQVNSAGLVMFGLLLFLYIYENFKIEYSYILLVLYSFIDFGFIYLFFALLFFSLHIKNRILSIFSISSLFISLYIYGTGISGSPKGHLLDVLAVYFAIFSPIVFAYIVYVLYRKFYFKEIDLVWFISTVVLVLSLLLSLRQRIELELFAPYIILALPLVAQTFTKSYRVRLKIFRKKYKVIFIVSLIFLLLNSFIVLFNKELYRFIDNPKKHFAYKMYVAKELAFKLKQMNINCVKTNNRLSKRLRFYEISQCDKYILNEYDLRSDNLSNVTISYRNEIVYKANVTKINNE